MRIALKIIVRLAHGSHYVLGTLTHTGPAFDGESTMDTILYTVECMDARGQWSDVGTYPSRVQAVQHERRCWDAGHMSLIRAWSPDLPIGPLQAKYTGDGRLVDHEVSTPNSRVWELARNYLISADDDGTEHDAVDGELAMPPGHWDNWDDMGRNVVEGEGYQGRTWSPSGPLWAGHGSMPHRSR